MSPIVARTDEDDGPAARHEEQIGVLFAVQDLLEGIKTGVNRAAAAPAAPVVNVAAPNVTVAAPPAAVVNIPPPAKAPTGFRMTVVECDNMGSIKVVDVKYTY